MKVRFEQSLPRNRFQRHRHPTSTLPPFVNHNTFLTPSNAILTFECDRKLQLLLRDTPSLFPPVAGVKYPPQVSPALLPGL